MKTILLAATLAVASLGAHAERFPADVTTVNGLHLGNELHFCPAGWYGDTTPTGVYCSNWSTGADIYLVNNRVYHIGFNTNNRATFDALRADLTRKYGQAGANPKGNGVVWHHDGLVTEASMVRNGLWVVGTTLRQWPAQWD